MRLSVEKNLIFNFKILDFLGLLFFIVSARFFYFLFRFGIALVVMATSGIFGMTSSLVICFLVRYLRVCYVELPFVILRVGVLLFYSMKGMGIDGPSVFLYFWLLFVERFSLPLAYSV